MLFVKIFAVCLVLLATIVDAILLGGIPWIKAKGEFLNWKPDNSDNSVLVAGDYNEDVNGGHYPSYNPALNHPPPGPNYPLPANYQFPGPYYQHLGPYYQPPGPYYQPPGPYYQPPGPYYQPPRPYYQPPGPNYQPPEPYYQPPGPTYPRPHFSAPPSQPEGNTQ